MLELTSLRTRSSKTYDLGKLTDGRNRYAIDSVIGAMHYKVDPTDKELSWLDIDTNLCNGEVVAAPYIGRILNKGIGYRVESRWGGWYTVELDVPTVSKLELPRILGNRAIWYDVFEDCDVVVEFRNTQVSMYRVLKSSRAPLAYSIIINHSADPHSVLKKVAPALDATGREVFMDSIPSPGGRVERLVLEDNLVYPIIDATEINEQVDTSSDDATEMDNGDIDVTANDLLFYTFSSTDMKSFARFEAAIPQSVTIGTCYVQLYVSGASTMNQNIYFEKAASPSTCSGDNNDISSRTTTTAAVWWSEVWGSTGVWEGADIELKTVLQEVVNAFTTTYVAWISKRHSVTNHTATARTIDFSPSLSPKIHIEYSVGDAIPSGRSYAQVF